MIPGLAMDPGIRRDERFVAKRLEQVFNRCFAQRWRTRLVGGAVRATEDEVHSNPRARSAVMRVAEKIA